jgi:hypothetical protein
MQTYFHLWWKCCRLVYERQITLRSLEQGAFCHSSERDIALGQTFLHLMKGQRKKLIGTDSIRNYITKSICQCMQLTQNYCRREGDNNMLTGKQCGLLYWPHIMVLVLLFGGFHNQLHFKITQWCIQSVHNQVNLDGDLMDGDNMWHHKPKDHNLNDYCCEKNKNLS